MGKGGHGLSGTMVPAHPQKLRVGNLVLQYHCLPPFMPSLLNTQPLSHAHPFARSAFLPSSPPSDRAVDFLNPLPLPTQPLSHVHPLRGLLFPEFSPFRPSCKPSILPTPFRAPFPSPPPPCEVSFSPSSTPLTEL